MGHGRGMGRLAVIGHAHFAHADAGHGLKVDARRMHHHCGIQPVKRPVLCHQFLAAAHFLSRGAEIADAAGQAAIQRRKAKRCTKAGRGDDVVAAGMADAGQGVILRQDRHFRAALAEA